MRFPTIFAPVLRERSISLGLIGLGVVLVGANALGYHLWRCTFHDATGLPCPGCGVTRGMTALLRGRWHDAVHWHPFTPLIAFATLMLAVSALLTKAARTRLANIVETFERCTGFTLIAIFSLVAYGVWRIFAWPHWPE